MRFPNWFPSLRSWFNTVAVIFLMIGISYLLMYLLVIVLNLLRFAPWLSGTFIFLYFLFPVVAIAFLHHWLHRFLDAFFPESKLPGDEGNVGFFPDIISWWEGIYGWCVNIFSSLFVSYFLGIFAFSPYSSNLLSILNKNLSQYSFSLPQVRFLILQMIIAAYLYQLEYLAKKRLVAASRM
ncbi:MAG: hypothetical protein AAF208_05060 [Cyanobacteria bacterium P01_A01_bin.45]